MNEKPRFFFEPDPQIEPTGLDATAQAMFGISEGEENQADAFFSTLKDAGIIKDMVQDGFEPKTAESQASMRRLESPLLQLDFGTYQDNYAVHVTPVHAKKNLSSESSIKHALRELVVVMNEYVPYTCKVNLFLPRDEWKMKVISAVVVGGATAWNFDHERFESEAAPKIFSAIEQVIMRYSR